MVGIHVLHMDGEVAQSPRTHSGAQVDRLVRDSVLACEGAVGSMAVTDKQRLPVEPGQQVTLELRSRERTAPSDGIDRAPLAVARDQDAVQFTGNAPLGSAAAAAARWPIELARTFLRFEQKCFVSLDDAIQERGPVELDPG